MHFIQYNQHFSSPFINITSDLSQLSFAVTNYFAIMALIVVHYLDNNHVHFDHHLIIGNKQHLIIGSVLWNYQNADYNDSLPMFQFAQS